MYCMFFLNMKLTFIISIVIFYSQVLKPYVLHVFFLSILVQQCLVQRPVYPQYIISEPSWAQRNFQLNSLLRILNFLTSSENLSTYFSFLLPTPILSDYKKVFTVKEKDKPYKVILSMVIPNILFVLFAFFFFYMYL